ncbi:hypothetical protein BT69DRAFT_1283837 [Atractiella rhizophila]|nr:hypothetical protein BT69DRAFT_1283837 [Atractiella rhizophila]
MASISKGTSNPPDLCLYTIDTRVSSFATPQCITLDTSQCLRGHGYRSIKLFVPRRHHLYQRTVISHVDLIPLSETSHACDLSVYLPLTDNRFYTTTASDPQEKRQFLTANGLHAKMKGWLEISPEAHCTEAVYDFRAQRYLPADAPEVNHDFIVRLAPQLATSQVSEMPVELLEVVFSFLYISSSRVDRHITAAPLLAVSKRWRAVAAAYLPEPRGIQQKVSRLRAYPGAGRRWTDFFVNSYLPMEELKLVADSSHQIKTTIFTVSDVHWSKAEREELMWSMSRWKTLYKLTFDRGWETDDMELFFANTQSLQSLAIITGRMITPFDDAIIYKGLDIELPRLYTLHLYHSPIEGTVWPGVIKASANLKNLHLYFCAPIPNSLVTDSLLLRLTWFHLDLRTVIGEEDAALKFRVPYPLHHTNFQNICELVLDGLHENSNLLPYDFFTQLLSDKGFLREFFNLWHLDLIALHIGPEGWQEVFDWLYLPGRFFRVSNFFGQWDDATMKGYSRVIKEREDLPGLRLGIGEVNEN